MIATLTLGHTKGIDILLTNPKTGKLFKVEVKTTTSGITRSKLFGSNYEWMMSEKHDTKMPGTFLNNDAFSNDKILTRTPPPPCPPVQSVP